MAIIVIESDVLEAVPTITPFWAGLLTSGVNSEATRAAPGLDGVLSMDAMEEARLVVLAAVQAFALGKSWLASETTGPYNAVYRQRTGSGVLSAGDKARLREIAGQAAAGPAGPVGSFPAPVSYASLFTTP